MNKCSDIEKKLPYYIEGYVSSQEQETISKHLASCSNCTHIFEELKKTFTILNNIDEIEPPPWLSRKIMAQVREESERKKGILKRIFFPLHIKIPAEVFAVCLVITMAIYIFKITDPQVNSIESYNETKITAEYPYNKIEQKEHTRTEQPPAVSKEKIMPEKKYKKDTDKPVTAKKDGADIVASMEELPVPQLSVPNTTEPSATKLIEEEHREYLYQPSPSSSAMSNNTVKKKNTITANDKKQVHRSYSDSDSIVGILQLKSSDAKRQQNITITVKKGNIIYIKEKIKAILKNSGATELKEELREDTGIITAVLPACNLIELHEKFKIIGEIKENPPLYDIPGENIFVLIEIIQTE